MPQPFGRALANEIKYPHIVELAVAANVRAMSAVTSQHDDSV